MPSAAPELIKSCGTNSKCKKASYSGRCCFTHRTIHANSKREPEIEWVAYNEDGTVFRAIKQDKNWSKRIIDTHTNANKKVDLTLQFGGKVGTLGAEFDKKYFVCKATYQEAVDGDLEELSVTKRYPEEQVIRIERK